MLMLSFDEINRNSFEFNPLLDEDDENTLWRSIGRTVHLNHHV